MEIAAFISAGILLAAFGGAAGFMLGRYVWPVIRGSDPAALLSAQTEVARLQEECRSLRMRAEQLEAERVAATEDLRRSERGAASLRERVDNLTRQVEGQGKLVREVEGQRDAAAAEARTAEADVARLTERERALSAKIAEQATQLADQQQLLTSEFENIATRFSRPMRLSFLRTRKRHWRPFWTRCANDCRISRRR
jgi:predicted  nucleic acid-binding Zn-ribbon protein